MSDPTLRPVFVGLRAGLHALVVALLVLVVVRIAVARPEPVGAALALTALFAVVYGAGASRSSLRPIVRVSRYRPTAERHADAGRTRVGPVVWILVLTALWLALIALVPEAAYLAFPLFFLYLHVLPGWRGPALVVVATGVAIGAIGAHGGYTVGGIVGPVVGAGVALLIGLGYRALAREAAEREALLAELMATRDLLAITEREQGVLAERGRLAREIHDTVAQGLSSIQMLLHAVEREDPERSGIEHIRLARVTAADGLAEARRFVRELTPPTLEQGLPAALRRLAAAQGAGLVVEVSAPTSVDLPMDVQTTLLRVAQGALANTAQHAQATSARIELIVDPSTTTLVVSDDGVGFDPVRVRQSAASDSFGLDAIRDRVASLDGELRIDSGEGGTSVSVVLARGVG